MFETLENNPTLRDRVLGLTAIGAILVGGAAGSANLPAAREHGVHASGAANQNGADRGQTEHPIA